MPVPSLVRFVLSAVLVIKGGPASVSPLPPTRRRGSTAIPLLPPPPLDIRAFVQSVALAFIARLVAISPLRSMFRFRTTAGCRIGQRLVRRFVPSMFSCTRSSRGARTILPVVPLPLPPFQDGRNVPQLPAPHVPGDRLQPPPPCRLRFCELAQPRLGLASLLGQQGFVVILGLPDNVPEKAGVWFCLVGGPA